MCYSKIFSHLHAQNLMFLFINIAVLSVFPQNDVFWYNFQLPLMSQKCTHFCNCTVSIIAIFDFSAVRNTGIIDFEFNQ